MWQKTQNEPRLKISLYITTNQSINQQGTGIPMFHTLMRVITATMPHENPIMTTKLYGKKRKFLEISKNLLNSQSA